MTGLLVSVRNAQEARDALAGGADIIDVKEPSRGSLGMADPAVWAEVAATVNGRAPVSAALGELADFDCDTGQAAACLQFAKLGLAGCAAAPDWRERWAEAVRSFPGTVGSIAVSYADWRTAQAPPPDEIIETGRRLGCTGWLMDTHDKNCGGLLDRVSIGEVLRWIEQARRREMTVVLAGSLTVDSMRRVFPLGPDYIAVRGAVCQNGREGTIDANLVRQLAAKVASARRAPSAAYRAKT